MHDADVLDIMRPCCGHGGRTGFRSQALRFLGPRDGSGMTNPTVRDALIEEAWCLIRATEAKKSGLRRSTEYMRDVLSILGKTRRMCPLLAACLLD